MSKAVPEIPVSIHIGWHKCASTFLQSEVFPRVGYDVEYLNRPAILDTHSQTLIDLVQSETCDPEYIKSAICRTSDAVLQRPLLITHEELSGHPLGYGLLNPQQTAQNLAHSFPNARILAITRSQIGYIESLYCYRVAIRGHETRTLNQFVRDGLRDGLINHLSYDHLIGEYVRLFGQDNVLVLPLELLQQDQNAFVERICNHIGAPTPLDITRSTTNASTRQALTINLFRLMNIGFKGLLHSRAMVSNTSRKALDPKQTKIAPFWEMRHAYYSRQRRMAYGLKKAFPNLSRLDMHRIDALYALSDKFSASNEALLAKNFIDWNPAKFGYPMMSNK